MSLSWENKSPALTLFIIAGIMIFSGIGFRDAWPPDEPRFALVAKEMVASGQWLIPMRGGEIYPDKPPVFMWCIAFVYLLTGSLKVAILLPNAIASLITLGLTYRLSRSLSNEKVAVLSMLILIITPQFIIQAKFAQIDALVACFVWIGVCGLIKHFYIHENWRWYFTAWFFMGLGIITKGVGFLPVLLFIPIGLFAVHKRVNKGTWKARSLLGPILMLAVVALWLAPLLYLGFIKNDVNVQRYLSNILFKQTAQRYANAWHHIEPWYYYLVEVIPFFWIAPIAVILSKIRHLKRELEKSPAYSSLLMWVLLVVIFFSLSPGKRGVYILPALPALSMVSGYMLANLGAYGALALFSRVVTIMISSTILCCGLTIFFVESIAIKLASRFYIDIDAISALSAILIFTGAAGLTAHVIFVVARKNATGSQSTVLVRQILLWFIVMSVIPATMGAWVMNDYRTPRILLDNAQATIHSLSEDKFVPFEVGIVSFKEQYLLYSPFDFVHFGYHTDKAVENGSAWAWLYAGAKKNDSHQRTIYTDAPKTRRFLLVPKDYAFRCADMSAAVSLGVAHRDEWLLVPDSAATPSCSLPTSTSTFTTK